MGPWIPVALKATWDILWELGHILTRPSQEEGTALGAILVCWILVTSVIGTYSLLRRAWRWIARLWNRVMRRRRMKALGEKIDEAYFSLRRVCEPSTLDTENPRNADFMKAEARDMINRPLRALLVKAEHSPPGMCTTEDESLREWFDYLGELRASRDWSD